MLVKARKIAGGKIVYKGITFPNLQSAQHYASRTVRGFTRRVGNIEQGYYDKNTGVFHPVRASWDYDADRAGEYDSDDDSPRKRSGSKKRKTSAKKSVAKTKTKAKAKTKKSAAKSRKPTKAKKRK